jgi:FkbM family methyltransferase
LINFDLNIDEVISFEMKKIYNKLYNLIPYKQRIFSVLKTVWQPGESIYRHLHFHGLLTVPVQDSSSFKMMHYGYQIENEIFWAGITNGWEKESLKLWIELCKDSKVILDIGANTGVYSLVAKAVNSEAEIYAFEPVNRVFSKLKQNIDLNNYNINAYEIAISDKDGKAIIYDTSTEHIYSVTVNKNLASVNTVVTETEIKTITLNTFIKQNNIESVDLIKIDVETHEPEVLDGFSDYLGKFRPTLLIEILNSEVGERVGRILNNLDYLYFNIDERGSVRRVEKITKSDYYNYLVCNFTIAKKIGLI